MGAWKKINWVNDVLLLIIINITKVETVNEIEIEDLKALELDTNRNDTKIHKKNHTFYSFNFMVPFSNIL